MPARILYSAIFYLLTPFICLRLWWRGRRVPGYRQRWRQRFGWVPPIPASRRVIWVHAVSVGETVAAAPLIRQLQQRYPDYLLAVTTTTPTGSDRVVAIFGDSVHHSYAPYDLPGSVARFLRRVHPALLIVMETELWTNLVHRCQRLGIPVVVANARMSAKSAAGYRRFRSLTAPMLASLSAVAAQHGDDGQRFLDLGLRPDQLRVTGNIKFDLELSDSQRRQAAELGAQWRGAAGRPVWLAASTHRGEDEIVLAAFAAVLADRPDTLLVLVPRHPDRFDQVAALCASKGFRVARRSSGLPPDHCQVLLGDTMGELPVFFGACDLAFVGGSLVPSGGHNLLEPAAWQVAILSGPQLFNFAEVSALLLEAGGLEICRDGNELAAAVIHLLGDGELRRTRGLAAHQVVVANRGAMARLLVIIAELLGQSPGTDPARH